MNLAQYFSGPCLKNFQTGKRCLHSQPGGSFSIIAECSCHVFLLLSFPVTQVFSILNQWVCSFWNFWNRSGWPCIAVAVTQCFYWLDPLEKKKEKEKSGLTTKFGKGKKGILHSCLCFFSCKAPYYFSIIK